MFEQQDFDDPWRTVYEWRMGAAWFTASALTLLVSKTLPVPSRFGVATALITAGIGMYRMAQAMKRGKETDRIRFSGKQFISIPELIEIGKKAKANQKLWLGRGFHWTDIEANRMHQLINQGIAKRFGKEILHREGAYWIHGLGAEEDCVTELANLVGHTLITGTTRVGKAQPLYAKVHTTSGWSTMGGLKLGDEVSTPDGGSSQVLEIFPQGKLDIFEITTEDGRKARACRDHLWNLAPTRLVRVDSEAVASPNVTHVRERSVLTRTTAQLIAMLDSGLQIALPLPSPVEKPRKLLPDDPYWLGCNLMRGAGNLKEIPAEFKEASVKQRLELVRGILDHQASIDLDGTICCQVPNPKLAKDFQEVIWSIGGYCRVDPDAQIIIRHAFPWTLFSVHPEHTFPPAWGSRNVQAESVGIVSVEYVGQEEAQCILIAHEEHLYITDDYIVTHNTRLFDLLIGQAIVRGEPVIIIDPKGDHELAENARKICEALGQPERFAYFHPAHPDKSCSIDPLRNWNRKTELASRVAALIPSETGADPFTAFGWKVLNDIVNGLIATGQRPNLQKLRRYIEGGPDDLLLKSLRIHFRKNVNDWEGRISSFVKKERDPLLAYISFYKNVVAHEVPAPDLEGLISTFEHNRDHFQKMVASLIPILSMLTSGQLGDLLSPDFEPGHDRRITDMANVIRKDMVLYVGLDSLPDGTVGSAIGSVLLADATAVAGDRYNYDIKSTKPINLFVDEAAEVINVPTIQLMNKGGGAGFRVTIATQTFADFSVRLGSPEKARQVLANTNNKITLRVLDAETQQYIADGIPKIKIDAMAVAYGHAVDPDIHHDYSAAYREQATKEEADLIPPAILSELPPLHFFGRLSGGRTIKGRLPILGEPK